MSKIVYIVDDDPDLCFALKNLVEKQGFEAVTFTDPLIALSTMREVEPDFVFVDMTMPRLDGLKFVDRMRAMGLSSEVCLCTGFPTPRVRVQAEEQHLSYMTKPFSTRSILGTLSDWSAKVRSAVS